MLDFWYSERCTRTNKLIICILTCSVIYAASRFAALSPLFVMMSLAIGMLIHLLKMKSVKIADENPYKEGFTILFFIMPLVATITLLGSLPNDFRWAHILQSLGFIALGLFILSIHSQRSPRH